MSRSIQIELEEFDENLEAEVVERVFRMSGTQGPKPEVISQLAEPRTKYLGKHVERTQIFCHLLTLALRFDTAYENVIDDNYIKHIYYAAALHDIGKNGIPKQLLLKKRLTPYEHDVVQSHAEIGRRILIKLFNRYSHNEFSRLCIEIAGSHHEKWDGSGYPQGRYGFDIPLSARIMSLVDAYDSLRSELPCKEAVSHKDSVRVIMEGGGIDFDPSVVKAFSNIESKFEALYQTIQ